MDMLSGGTNSFEGRRMALNPESSDPTAYFSGKLFTPKSRFTTSSKEAFSNEYLKVEESVKQHKLSKYKKLRDSSPMLLSYGNNIPESVLKVRNQGSENDFNASGTFQSLMNNNATDDKYFTESSKIFGNFVSKAEIAKTRELMRSSDAPVAMGRSGQRIERGVKSTGLIGERLNINCDSSKNSLVQRSWLYSDDPALKYKLEGAPKASMPEGVSLPIGKNDEKYARGEHLVKAGANYRRVYHINAGPTSKGIRCGPVFMDYNEPNQ